MSKKRFIIIVLVALLAIPTTTKAQTLEKQLEPIKQQMLTLFGNAFSNIFNIGKDSINPYRIKVSSSTHGLAALNNLDTYLSGYNYTGAGYRFAHENYRNAHTGNYNWKYQTLFSGTLGYTELYDSKQYMLMLDRSWSGYHPFCINERLQLLAGAQIQFAGGALYVPSNGNSLVSVKLRTSLAATGMAIYRIPLKSRELTTRLQFDMPLVGVAFSPSYGQSYYEIFGLGNYSNIFHFTNLFSCPSWRSTLSVDIPVGKRHHTTLRVAYTADIYQSEINEIRTHQYSHAFSLGIVKTLYKIKKGDRLKAYSPF